MPSSAGPALAVEASTLVVGSRHDVRADKSIPVQNGPQGGQVHCTDAAAGASGDSGRTSTL